MEEAGIIDGEEEVVDTGQEAEEVVDTGQVAEEVAEEEVVFGVVYGVAAEDDGVVAEDDGEVAEVEEDGERKVR